ncbi:MAG: UDP-glucose/GDP-mannose dehydrogenase [Acidimicrobiaceae bacterium]|nr:MAG: UDP-glucose/GDP-mannose dehydrogenase [Acidimicrobiaceae bacterium]
MATNLDVLLGRIADRTAKVVVVGQGYVGLPVAMRAVSVGFPVVGFEASPERVKSLAAGESYVGDISDVELAAALSAGYLPTGDAADLAGFDVAVISVPTPLAEGMPDLSYIEAAGRTLAEHLSPGACVVLESTTYPGTTSELLVPILEHRSGLSIGEFFCGYSPERIDPGNATHGLQNTPKVVSGVDEPSLAAVDAFFSTIVDQTVPVGSAAEAELVKLLENTFRHVNIALVNELAMFARDLGVDVWRAIDAASTKPFGYMRFTPGPGVGGHCLPIDPSYLAWRVKQHLGHTFRFVELANDVNEHMPDYVRQRVAALLNGQRKSVNGSRILLLGLAYKRGTSDWRESPSVQVAEQLAASGGEIVFCDPYIADVNTHHLRFPLVPFSTDELAAADVVVVLVDHPEFDPATIARHGRLVFDTKNHLRGQQFVGEVL